MPSQSTPVPTASGRTGARRAITVAGAVVAALALWGLTGPVAGIDLAARLGEAVQPVGPAAVVAASLVAGLAAWGLLAVLERLVRRPRRVWTIVAVVVLVLSLAGPLGAADTGSMLALAGMHLVVAAVLIYGLAPTARAR
ncbi:DUF6069 family protein [Sphaerisporangium fuscum]|uniref:DUF6069 family protein n=1 Tax=Sphaerisporangium fuscum TaxID=2835868 RepID=UPI001BDD035D|nr:DUF6069 family protein [Sphaerisporangium fuscum]